MGQFNELVDSFRTKFWIDEHQWFVRCHLNGQDKLDERYSIDVFTLPYAFKDFLGIKNCILAKSTSPHDNEYLTCDHVTELFSGSSYFNDSILSRVRFRNIQHLSVLLPFDEQIVPTVFKLDHLATLHVFANKNENLDVIQSQLQMLLDRTPCLHSLRLGPWSRSNSQVPLKEITSISVRRLELQDVDYSNESRYYDENECIQLSRSPLGIQCETLQIKVQNQRTVINLVNNMPNLRALNVQCKDDNWIEENNIKMMNTSNGYANNYHHHVR